MRVFLGFCILFATTVAHPTGPCCPCEPPKEPCGPPPKPCGPPPEPCGPPPEPCEPPKPSDESCSCSSSTTISVTTETKFVCDKELYPSVIPKDWNIMTFNTQCATIALQGVWYLQMTTPSVLIDGAIASHTGLFYNGWPCVNTRLCFQDSTPDCPIDYNTDYYMLDSSFNLATQSIEKTLALLRAACGPDSPLAIFNVATQPYYPSKLKELEAIIDDKLYSRPCDDIYVRDYTLCIIGGDDAWSEYMVFAIVNKYNNVVCGNDHHIIWVLTRKQVPQWETYKKAFEDIKASNLCPYYLISHDQSIILNEIPSISPEDLEGTIDSTLITSLTSTTTSTTSSDTSTTSTSTTSKSVTSETSINDDSTSITSTVSKSTTVESTVEFVLKPDCPSPYELEIYSYCKSVKIIKNMAPETIREALCGMWYVNSATPCLLSESDGSVGILNTAFPACSIQVLFDDSILTPWTTTTTTMMIERGFNAITGDMSTTRSIIGSACDGSVPYCSFWVYCEGYYKTVIEKSCPITPEELVFQSPGELYRESYMICMVGYLANEYLLFYIPNQYKNLLYENNDFGNFIVLTRNRIISADIVDAINQDILRSGYNIQYLVSIDQNVDITESFTFKESYFEYSSTSVSSSSSSTTVSSGSVVKACSTVTETSSSSDDGCSC